MKQRENRLCKGYYRKNLITSLSLCAFLAVGTSVFAVESLPWNDNFEDYSEDQTLIGANGWGATTNAVKAQSAVTYDSSDYAAHVPDYAAVSNTFDGLDTKVWVDMYVKRRLADSVPSIESNETAVFYFDSSSNLVVRDGSTWVTNTTDAAGNTAVKYATGTWVRLSTCLNYTSRKWSLFVEDDLMAQDLGFVDQTSPSSGFEMLKVTNRCYLDDVWVNTHYPTNNGDANGELTGDLDGDSMPDAWEVHYWGNITSEGGSDDSDSDGRSSQLEYLDGTDPTDASSPGSFSSWELPYVEYFEGKAAGTSISGWKGWSVVAGTLNSSFVSSSYQGSGALGVSSGEVALTISDSEQTISNTWVQVYTKPVLYSDVPGSAPAATNAACFCVTTGGCLYAYSSNVWTNVASVPTGEWLGFGVHLDFNEKKWDLYVDTNSASSYTGEGRRFIRANDDPLDFNSLASNKTQLTQVAITNNSTNLTYIDAVSVSKAYTNCSASLTNAVAVDRRANQTQLTSVPPYSYSDKSLAADSQLAQDMSRDLDGLNNTATFADRLKIFNTNGWNVYNLDTSTNWQASVGMAPDDISIELPGGMWLDRKGLNDVIVFYPYASEPGTFQETLYGYEHTNKKGWNMLVWPTVRSARDINDGLGFSPAVTDGRVPKLRIYDSGSYKTFWWSSSNSEWWEGRSKAVYTLKPGQVFWHYRAQSGSATWTVPSD